MQGSEFYEVFRDFVGADLKSLPHPYIVTYLFPEVPVAVCRPLDPPFDHLAITHYGEVFLWKPLLLTHLESFKIIDPTSILIPKLSSTNRQYVVLQNIKKGFRKAYFTDRLVMDRFYNVKLTEPVVIEHIDGNYSNNHYNNLIAHYYPGDPREETVIENL